MLENSSEELKMRHEVSEKQVNGVWRGKKREQMDKALQWTPEMIRRK